MLPTAAASCCVRLAACTLCVAASRSQLSFPCRLPCRHAARQPAQPAGHGAPLPAHRLSGQDLFVHSMEGGQCQCQWVAVVVLSLGLLCSLGAAGRCTGTGIEPTPELQPQGLACFNHHRRVPPCAAAPLRSQVGWLSGPADMIKAVAKAHQFITFTVPSSLQASRGMHSYDGALCLEQAGWRPAMHAASRAAHRCHPPFRRLRAPFSHASPAQSRHVSPALLPLSSEPWRTAWTASRPSTAAWAQCSSRSGSCWSGSLQTLASGCCRQMAPTFWWPTLRVFCRMAAARMTWRWVRGVCLEVAWQCGCVENQQRALHHVAAESSAESPCSNADSARTSRSSAAKWR